VAATEVLSRGRAAFDREAWSEAYELLMAADRRSPLAPEDLDRLATAAYLLGEETASAEIRTRAHTSFLARGDTARAARSAFWLAFASLDRPNQQAVASGWLGRVRRLLDDCPAECAERGFWLCASGFQKIGEGDIAYAESAFTEAARIGAACGDADLTALARHAEGRVLLRHHQTARGLAMFDEVMVAITCGEVGPMVAGVVYCSVIGACHEVFDLRRAQEWTTMLASWCAAHPDMMPFSGSCLVRRSELLQFHGAWAESLDEATRACERTAHASGQHDAGAAWYQLGEMHRLRGAVEDAEAAYRRAAMAGRTPEPGLALLRLAQGQTTAAAMGIQRALAEMRSPRRRIDVLRAAVEIQLQAGDIASAAAAADQLAALTSELTAPFLLAAAAGARGAIALAGGDVDGALTALRTGSALWQDVDAPYELARTRAQIGAAYLRLGDEEGARMEFEAAQEVFERIGAAPDATQMAERLAHWSRQPPSGLTGRELDVLRLVATGRTNRDIARELAIAEKTVARHISNIFLKLDLSSRSAATAYAYEHKLL